MNSNNGDEPPLYAPQADHAYPLELVAKIAASLLPTAMVSANTEKLPATLKRWKFALPFDSDPFYLAADSAVRLLDACKHKLDFMTSAQRLITENLEWRKEREKILAPLKKKFPDGEVPWVNGLLYITGKKSEATALGPFKRYLAARWRLSGMSASAAELKAEADLTIGEQVGFPIDCLPDYQTDFRSWYESVGIPEERQAAGKKRGAK